MTGPPAVRLRARSTAALALASAVGLAAFFWPFFAAPQSSVVAHAQDAPWLFAVLVPVVLVVVLAQIADGALGSKGVALLGLLSALVAVLRPLGAGVAGLEPFWFVILAAGRVLGPGFGFMLGATSLLASAMLTGGVGPWLPFQMVAAGWFGLGAGLLPKRLSGRWEVVVLAGYGAVGAVAFGFVMNAWFWPYFTGSGTAIAFVPGDPAAENLGRLIAFSLATSLGYDLPRAALTATLTILFGPALLRSLRRASRKAQFEPDVRFEPDRQREPDVRFEPDRQREPDVRFEPAPKTAERPA